MTTLVTPEPYLTLEELADYMNVDQLPLELSQLVLDAAMDTVRNYMGQTITFVEDDVEMHDGRGLRRLRLRQRPVRDVTIVSVDGTELDESAWQIDGTFLDRIDNDVWSTGLKNISVTYDHGWDVPTEDDTPTYPVPADIRLVTLAAAKRRYESTTQDPTLTGETIGSYSYTRDTAALATSGVLLMAETAVLDRYAVRLIP